MARRSKGARGARVAIILALAIFIALQPLAAVIIYEASFGRRYTTAEEEALSLSDFDGLCRERHSFPTRGGGNLVGYLYRGEGDFEARGLVVFAHGMGRGGQTGYIDVFDIMVERGYAVFAYDATANDESEGKSVGGLPQGIIDLDYALRYVKGLDVLSGLPLFLMGYSWGGFSVANVLSYHPDVDGAVSLAGWNESMDLVRHRGRQYAGALAMLAMPFAELYEGIKYGEYANSSALSGFAAAECPIMIVHGELDETVPPEYGYLRYQSELGSDSRFTYRIYPERDHAVFRNADGSLDRELFFEIADFYDGIVG